MSRRTLPSSAPRSRSRCVAAFALSLAVAPSLCFAILLAPGCGPGGSADGTTGDAARGAGTGAGRGATAGARAVARADVRVAYALAERLPDALAAVATTELEPIELRDVVSGGEERVAIVAHAPARLRFPGVTVLPGARLVGAVGRPDAMLGRFPSADGARLAIAAARPGESSAPALWAIDLPPEAAGWTEFDIPLDGFVGQTVELALVSDPGGTAVGDLVAWARPRVVVPRGVEAAVGGTAGGGGNGDIDAVRIERDLLEADSAVTDGCTVRVAGVDIPERGLLDVAVQALRDPDASGPMTGPVRVEVRVDGRSIWHREPGSLGAAVTVAQRLPLDAFAGRRVSIEFDVCETEGGRALVWSKRMWLGSRAGVRRTASADPGRNLLLLVVDTLRADRLGAYGYARATSPHFDALAAQGRLYERASSSSSWTQPSVATILTGEPPTAHGVIEGRALPPRTLTLAEILQRRGYSTLGVSANPIVGALEGFHRGFGTFMQAPWIRAETAHELLLDWLEERRGTRWFAYVHVVDPHAPYGSLGAHRDAFTDGCATPYAAEGALFQLSETINFGRGDARYTDADIDCLSDLYDGEIRYWDAQLGALLDALDAAGELERTVVAVTADHGEEFLEHGNLGHGYHLYEESLHVPLLLLAPRKLTAARRAEPVSLVDLSQALQALVQGDGPPDAGAGGPLLQPPERRPVFAHTTEAWVPGTGYVTLASIRDGQRKLILRPHDGREELYDLAADPGERDDLAAADLADRARLRSLLDAWLAGARQHTIQTRGLDEETIEKLRSLGYIR